jgi:hypothetical protein
VLVLFILILFLIFLLPFLLLLHLQPALPAGSKSKMRIRITKRITIKRTSKRRTMAQPVAPPILPGQRVAIFLDEHASGATLGYYGTVVVADYASASYRVFVPFFSRTIEVRECDLISATLDDCAQKVTQSVDSLEVRFESEPRADNHELRGAFRRKGGPWHAFHFKRTASRTPHYEFRLQVSPPSREGVMIYDVPEKCFLSRGYAVGALAEFLGTESVDAHLP